MASIIGGFSESLLPVYTYIRCKFPPYFISKAYAKFRAVNALATCNVTLSPSLKRKIGAGEAIVYRSRDPLFTGKVNGLFADF